MHVKACGISRSHGSCGESVQRTEAKFRHWPRRRAAKCQSEEQRGSQRLQTGDGGKEKGRALNMQVKLKVTGDLSPGGVFFQCKEFSPELHISTACRVLESRENVTAHNIWLSQSQTARPYCHLQLQKHFHYGFSKPHITRLSLRCDKTRRRLMEALVTLTEKSRGGRWTRTETILASSSQQNTSNWWKQQHQTHSSVTDAPSTWSSSQCCPTCRPFGVKAAPQSSVSASGRSPAHWSPMKLNFLPPALRNQLWASIEGDKHGFMPLPPGADISHGFYAAGLATLIKVPLQWHRLHVPLWLLLSVLMVLMLHLSLDGGKHFNFGEVFLQ